MKKLIFKIFAFLFYANAVLCANPADPAEVLGATALPPVDDISQKFPYGVTAKTPPKLTRINYEGQMPYHKHRIQLRVFQGCPQIEISEGGRLWTTWFASNVQAERSPFHHDQFSVISTSGDGGKTWEEVFVFDPSYLFNAGASDPLLWKDPKGQIRFVGLRNMAVEDKELGNTTAWEFIAKDPENPHTQWSNPRLLGNKNMSIMKPLLMSDGTILRPMDEFSKIGNPQAPRIRFLSETIDGKPLFVSQVSDPDASFAEQMPIERKDGSLFSFYRTKAGQKFMESFDGGKTWKLGGYYHMQFSIDTKCILLKLKSGKVLLVANDVQMREENGKRNYFFTDANGKETPLKGSSRMRMSAYLSDDDCKTFQKKLLLCDDGVLSYPSATIAKDGSIYIVYDQGRATIGQHTIFLSKITEADIEAGKIISPESFLNRIISRPSLQGGGRREGDKI